MDLAQMESVPTPVRVSTSLAVIVVGFEPRMVVAGRLMSPIWKYVWIRVSYMGFIE